MTQNELFWGQLTITQMYEQMDSFFEQISNKSLLKTLNTFETLLKKLRLQ